MKKHTQNGFGHLGLLLFAVIVVLIGLIGYKVYNRNNSATNNSQVDNNSSAQAIKSSSDLNSAAATLNSQNIDGDLNPDSLNQDVQTLL